MISYKNNEIIMDKELNLIDGFHRFGVIFK